MKYIHIYTSIIQYRNWYLSARMINKDVSYVFKEKVYQRLRNSYVSEV